MKNTHVCPKCQSKDIVLIPISVQSGLGIGRFSIIEKECYLCCECGYTEEWINKRWIPNLKDKFE